jgi:hypothetical protein
MNPTRSAIYRSVCTSLLRDLFSSVHLPQPAAAQIIVASVPIPSASAGQVAVNPALNKIYAGGGPNAGGTSLTVIDGSTFGVITTISPSAGVSVDMKNDNVWTGSLTAADVVVYAGSNNVEISSTKADCLPGGRHL